MIDRQGGMVVFMCDVCGDELKTDQTDFREALAELRRRNWRSAKIDLAWHYTCPLCGLPGERPMLARTARLAR